jgi:hypothetical protein
MKIASPRFPVKMKISRQKSPYFPVKMKIKWSHLKKNYLKENSFLMGLTLLDWRPASPQEKTPRINTTRADLPNLSGREKALAPRPGDLSDTIRAQNPLRDRVAFITVIALCGKHQHGFKV